MRHNFNAQRTTHTYIHPKADTSLLLLQLSTLL